MKTISIKLYLRISFILVFAMLIAPSAAFAIYAGSSIPAYNNPISGNGFVTSTGETIPFVDGSTEHKTTVGVAPSSPPVKTKPNTNWKKAIDTSKKVVAPPPAPPVKPSSPSGRYDGDSHGGSIYSGGHSERIVNGCTEHVSGYRYYCVPDSCVTFHRGAPHYRVKSSCSAYDYKRVFNNASAPQANHVCNSITGSGGDYWAICKPPKVDCKFSDGQTVAVGTTMTLYKDSVVQYGNTCQSQQRTCQSDGTFSGSSSYSKTSCVIQNPEITGMSITADPAIVRKGEDSTIEWHGGNADSCMVTGPSFDSDAHDGSSVITNMQNSSRYTLKCTLGPTYRSESVEVHVLPTYQET